MKGYRYWTDKEIEYLEKSWGKRSLKTMSKYLGRSESSIKSKAVKMKLGSWEGNIEGFTPSMITKIVGRDRYTISRTWIRNNGLKVTRVGKHVIIAEHDLKEFMRTHEHLWSAKECDYYYFYTEKWFLDKLERERQGERPKQVIPWNNRDLELLKIYRQQGKKCPEIARLINRSTCSVQSKVKDIRKLEKIWMK